ncbi:unnamed protein product, partial [Polarella glacialis]
VNVEEDLLLIAQLSGLRVRSARAQAVSSQLSLALAGLRTQSPRSPEESSDGGEGDHERTLKWPQQHDLEHDPRPATSSNSNNNN